ncbi:aminotransferase class III-fold pyridoxal phosphate-dependent enzyme [Streptomyces sp. NPDC016675]|uniref:aminotransferase class III-fold pyridoxal phosphate-dependent enzyme n=1 Tax=Streptomyces sp. NPDC016675 TaxID=3364970 RepID=UPI0036F827CC
MAESAYGGAAFGGAASGGRNAGPLTARRAADAPARALSPRRSGPTREPSARTYAGALPLVPVRARGLTIEGADGRRYLDCVSGAGTLPLGHNHPVVREAIRRVLDSGAPLQAGGLTTPVEDAFVTELLRTLPAGPGHRPRVRFCGPAGAEPVATAAALVRAATGRTRIVTLTESDHGATTDLLGPAGAGRRPAGVIFEPVRGAAGVLPAPEAWMRDLRRVTAERSVPLIADETESGVGWTGAFWAVEHGAVTPDVLVLSHAIGGSLPLAAVVYADDLHTAGPGAGTFRGNQLALAAGAATLAHVREHRLAEHAATLGSRMLARLRGLAQEFRCVGEVRGRGLMIGIEPVAPEGARETPGDGTGEACDAWDDAGGGRGGAGAGRALGSAATVAAAVQRECLRRGLIVGLAGPARNVVRLLPPLIITEEQTSAVLERLADALEAVERGRGDHALPGAARAAR